MTRKKTETPNNQTINELTQSAILNDLALGISKTENGYSIVEIVYNAETGESDLQDVIFAGTTRSEAIELFKITAVEKGLV